MPTASCGSGENSFAAQWIGIDGYPPSTSVEQDGTDSDCDQGVPTYYAWWELFPAAPVDLPSSDPVVPGDAMSAVVSVSGSTWTLWLHDASTVDPPWTFTTTVGQSGLAKSSAEWIVERPELCDTDCSHATLTTLADFGSTGFSDATANGEPISSFHNTALQMASYPNESTLLALPGPLDSTGEAFSDDWYHGS